MVRRGDDHDAVAPRAVHDGAADDGAVHHGAVHHGDESPPARRRRRWAEVLGVAWTVVAAALVLVRALRPGVSLGPFDILTRFGLTQEPGVPVHNTVLADQIQQFVPWMNLAWHQVHSGQLPLWNPDNVLGMPLAFNWQSGVFSLPVLIGYLVPVSFSFTAVVLTKLIVAGMGVYVLCRVLKMGPLAAAFGGSAFELSGPMVVHAGWPHTAVTCWAGWLLAGIVLVLKGERRLVGGVLVALSTALAIYGGHPESLIVTALATVVFVLVYLIFRWHHDRGVVRPLGDIALGVVCGVGLGAPLLFPGAQLAEGAARRSGSGAAPFPLTHVPNLLASGFQGHDFRTAAYTGVVVLAMAAVGTRMGWKQPHIPALAVVTVVTALLTFFSPASNLLHVLPQGSTVAWSRSVMLLALALAVLAAAGLDALVRAPRDRVVLVWMVSSFGAMTFVVGALALAAVGGLAPSVRVHAISLAWPGAQAVAGLALAAALMRPGRGAHARGAGRSLTRLGPAGLVVLETAFLLSAGIPFWSVSSSYFAPTPAITALRSTVGTGLVGFGGCRSLRYFKPSKNEVGIRPNANIGYGVHEMTVYDPIIPAAYYRSVVAVTRQHTPPSLRSLGMLCVKFSTAAQARVYGVQYLLEPHGRLRPQGTVRVGRAGNEAIFWVRGSAQATVLPAPAPGVIPPDTAPGIPVVVAHPDDATWRLVVHDKAASLVRFRVTDVPGWRATVDGHTLGLSSWSSGAMLEARVPAGEHVITLQYWPRAFSYGLVVGAASAGALVLTVTGATVLRRRRRHSPSP